TDVNDVPVAVQDGPVSTAEDTAIAVDVITNDTDLDGVIVPSSVTVTSASNGSTSVNPVNGEVTFTPDANFVGAGSFTYTVQDDDGATSNPITVVVNVTDVNDAPVAVQDGPFVTNEDTSLNSIDVLSNDIDLDGDTLTIQGTPSAINGSVSVNPDGTLNYTPDANFSGEDTVTYTVTDSNGDTDTSSFTVTVNPVADAPNIAFDSDVITSDGTVEEIPPPESTGLLLSFYDELNNANRTAALQEGIIDPATATSQAREINGFGTPRIQTAGATQTDGSTVAVEEGDSYSVTGLIYLEAGSSYEFFGYRDDSIRIELGGETILSTTGDSFGNFGGDTPPPGGIGNHVQGNIFTATESGYYTLEVYVNNVSGPGQFSLNIAVDGGAPQILNGSNFNIYSSVNELAAAGGQFSSFVTNTEPGQNTDGGFFPQAINVGMEDTLIEISNIAVSLTDNDGSEVIDSIVISGIPEGAVLTDSTSSFTATAGTDEIDILGWSLNDIAIQPPTGFTGEITLTVEATSRETANGDTATSSRDITVTVVDSSDISTGIDADLLGDDVVSGTDGDDTLTSNIGTVALAVDSDNVFNDDSAYTLSVGSLAAGLSVASITLVLTDGAFDPGAGGGEFGPVVTSPNGVGVTPADFSFNGPETELTIDFAEGDFTEGDSFSFGLDFDNVGPGNGNQGGLLGGNANLIVTLSDGSTETVVVAGSGNSSGATANLASSIVDGLSGDDTITGGDNDELLIGGTGDDTLIGNGGSDALQGGLGNDILTGGSGDDILAGGLGADTFRWQAGDEGTAASPAEDIISDFNAADGDVLNLQDLLQGEESGVLSDYLSFNFDGTNTTIEVSSQGDGNIDQIIRVDNIDLTGGIASDAAIIDNLINNNNLIVD
ncbi:tandem-95 repeat protein, partial [Porticoccus sp. GXU_MW_L64]